MDKLFTTPRPQLFKNLVINPFQTSSSTSSISLISPSILSFNFSKYLSAFGFLAIDRPRHFISQYLLFFQVFRLILAGLSYISPHILHFFVRIFFIARLFITFQANPNCFLCASWLGFDVILRTIV